MRNRFQIWGAAALFLVPLGCDPQDGSGTVPVVSSGAQPSMVTSSSQQPEVATGYDGTQGEMNDQAAADRDAAEAEMQRLLTVLASRVRGNGPRSIKARELLATSQSRWQAYAEAQVALEWPSPENMHYGSVHPMCVGLRWAGLIQARVKELRAMIDIEEGDVCASEWPDDWD